MIFYCLRLDDMLFTLSTRLPVILSVGPGLLGRIDQIIARHNLSFPNKLVVTMPVLKSIVISQIDGSCHDIFLVENYCLTEADRLIKHLESCPPDTLILAVGGGQVIDVVKYAATRAAMNYLSIPTALSNDGIYSPVIVLSDSSKRIRTNGNVPLGIVVDTAIVKSAPKAAIRSGIGDVISNRAALFDWQLASDKYGEFVNDFARTLSMMSYDMLLTLDPDDFGSEDFISRLAYCLVMSGLAMEIAGSSRPCSGSEHAISHAIDELFPQRSNYHGIQVGAATPFILRLHGQNTAILEEFMNKIGLPVSLEQCGFMPDEIARILIHARDSRSRKTILNEVDLAEAQKFC